MRKSTVLLYGIGAEAAAIVLLAALLAAGGLSGEGEEKNPGNTCAQEAVFIQEETEGQEKEYIKWVDFQVTAEAMRQAYTYDVESYGTECHLDWVDLLAILGVKYGGDFSGYRAEDMTRAAEKILSGEMTVEDYTRDMQYFSYYREAYRAVLGGMVGEYQIECAEETEDGSSESDQKTEKNADSSESDQKTEKNADSSESDTDTEKNVGSAGRRTKWKTCYGLKAFSPIARGFPYSDYDDFGAARSYGYRRNHLGHDLMGQVGTPVIAVESGKVTALGWNQYGGWRIGIESFDGIRYYYYAHLRQNRPYAEGLEVGDIVQAGDVIGYLGRTGYSKTENVNNIDEYHLHFGLQLIFDESQREGSKEIWVSGYELVRFLSQNRSEVQRNDETKEWTRVYQIRDPAAQVYSRE